VLQFFSFINRFFVGKDIFHLPKKDPIVNLLLSYMPWSGVGSFFIYLKLQNNLSKGKQL